jgi:hypothetical protein
LEPSDSGVLWAALIGFHQRIAQLEGERRCLRFRVADALHAALGVPVRVVRRYLRSRTDAPRTLPAPASSPVGHLAIEPPTG